MIKDDELIVQSKTILKELGIEINILEKKIDKINYYMTNNKKSNKSIEKRINRLINRFNLFKKKVDFFYEYKYMIDFMSEVTPSIDINNASDMFMNAFIIIEKCKMILQSNIKHIQLNLIEDELIDI